MGISVCSTLSGKVALKHPELGVLVREDGAAMVKIRDYGFTYHWSFGNASPLGYMSVSVKGKSKYLHRLVAECFIPNPSNKPSVDHINQNKSDNRVTNLRWATMSEQLLNITRQKRTPRRLISKFWNLESVPLLDGLT